MATVNAPAACDCGSPKNAEPLSPYQSSHIAARLDNHSRNFVAEDYWGEIAEGVLVHVQVCATNAAPSNFELDLVGPAGGFFDFAYFHVSWTF
jgi:hypothetical protein